MVQSIHGNNGSLAYFVEYEDDDDDDDDDGDSKGSGDHCEESEEEKGSVPSDLCEYRILSLTP